MQFVPRQEQAPCFQSPLYNAGVLAKSYVMARLVPICTDAQVQPSNQTFLKDICKKGSNAFPLTELLGMQIFSTKYSCAGARAMARSGKASALPALI